MLLNLLLGFCFTGDAALAEQQGLILSTELGTTNHYILTYKNIIFFDSKLLSNLLTNFPENVLTIFASIYMTPG
jgi:hypothetical protein